VPALVTIDDVRRTRALIGDRVRHTPAMPSGSVGGALGVDLWLKAELFQRTGAFKIRGVLGMLLSLPPDELGRGVVTFSAGNHAAALACGAALVGTHATVVMPQHAARVKIAATKRYGGSVVLTERSLFDVVREIVDRDGSLLVPPFDDPRIIAGAGGVGLELFEDAPPLDLVVVPVGGGGLLSGIAVTARGLSPQTRVVGVEPIGADGMSKALAAGEPVTITPRSVADGLAAPFAGVHTLAHVQALVDEVVTIDDATIGPAMRMLYERAKLAAEPAAAAGLAAMLCGAVTADPGSRVGLVVTGGNVDLDRLPELLHGEGLPRAP
jgi:threonine dehydratase